MVTKVPSPFASPFAKTLLAVSWVAYAGMLVALVIGRDVNLLIIVGWWTLAVPWVTWCFLSGVQIEPGRRVGGGPMYLRVPLEPGEVVLFQAPGLIGQAGGHVFVTDRRVIAVPIRFFRSVRTVRLSDITAVGCESKGIGWPVPRQRVRLAFAGGSLTLRPWAGPRIAGNRLAAFMGMIGADEFVRGLMAALEKAGVPPPLP